MGRSGRARSEASSRVEKSATWCPKASTMAPPQAIGPASSRGPRVGRAHVHRSASTSVPGLDLHLPLGPDRPTAMDLPVTPAVEQVGVRHDDDVTEGLAGRRPVAHDCECGTDAPVDARRMKAGRMKRRLRNGGQAPGANKDPSATSPWARPGQCRGAARMGETTWATGAVVVDGIQARGTTARAGTGQTGAGPPSRHHR